MGRVQGGGRGYNPTNIYPSDLEIGMTNVDNKSTTFLDLDISINNKLFDTKRHDKRRDFKFQVVNLPDLRSNKRMVYSKENFLEYANNLLNSAVFINDIKLLISKLINQRNKLYNTLRSFIQCKPAC